MTKYRYKVMMTAADEDCLSKRPVAFGDDEFLDFYAAGTAAKSHMSSQTCARCGENHEYCATEVERGEPGVLGGTHWRDVHPVQGTYETQPELPYDDNSLGW